MENENKFFQTFVGEIILSISYKADQRIFQRAHEGQTLLWKFI